MGWPKSAESPYEIEAIFGSDLRWVLSHPPTGYPPTTVRDNRGFKIEHSDISSTSSFASCLNVHALERIVPSTIHNPRESVGIQRFESIFE